MSRPSDWYVVDLGGDPTPGGAWGVRSLAREYGEIAASARSASTVLTRVQSSGSSAVWVGEAAEVFREKLEDFPENIAKCAASFEIVRDAMYSWASSVESWQTQADTNLNKARLARADIEAAQAVLEAAQTAAASVQGELDRALRTYNQYQFVEPPASVKVPSASQISQLRYRATGASSSTTSASGTVQEAQDRFDAAKALVLAAAEEFAAAAKTVVGTIEAARDAGVEADSWWEKIYHSDAWQVMVTIVTVVVIVAAIAAFFVTGPLALVIAAVAIVGNVILNAQDIMAFAAGDMSAVEFFITLALAVVPGGRALKSASNVADGVASVAVRSGGDLSSQLPAVVRRLDDGKMLSTGGRITRPPRGLDDGFEWAEEAYDVIRGNSRSADEILANSPSVLLADGRTINRADLDQVKAHLFENEHLLSDYNGGLVRARFDADPEISEAWFRLERGTFRETDELLIRHELSESTYLMDRPGATYQEAHEVANSIANWQAAIRQSQ